MSRERSGRLAISAEKRAARQRGQCRWCLGPVEPPRRTFCGDACVDEWKLRTDGKFRRQRVFARDAGVCAGCGRDCAALERELLNLLYANPSELLARLSKLGMTRRSYGALDRSLQPVVLGRVGGAVEPGLPVWEPGRTLWEADHVVECADGGGSCSLSNLQTMCLWCHRVKTAENQRRRAAARRTPEVPSSDLFGDVAPDDDLFEA
jgi:5-methylcytosine-specific restriction endonuclease McrA